MEKGAFQPAFQTIEQQTFGGSEEASIIFIN